MSNNNRMKFNELTEKCYMNLIRDISNPNCWKQAFELMKEIVFEIRKENPKLAFTLEQMDEATDYECDFEGWLEDCLDEMEMRGKYKIVLSMCDDLFDLFEWPNYTGSDIKFRKSLALQELGKENEAVDFCKKWMKAEPKNITTATASIYAYISSKELKEAENIVHQWIPDGVTCTDNNETMFIAATKLYKAMNNKKAQKKYDQQIQEYNRILEEDFLNIDDYDDCPF